MRKLTYMYGLILLCVMQACGSEKTGQQIVFMDNFQVFAEFKLKKEYDSLLFLEQENYKKQLDSLSFEIELAAAKPGPEADLLKKQYALSQQEFAGKLQEKSEEYTGKVYERLNSYVKTYGKEKQYDFILGSDGKGNVMYVNSAADITKELIRYINKKYNNE